MGAVILIRNLAALGLLVGAVALVVWAVRDGPIGRGLGRLLKKRGDYYDVEKMDDAEILARKYERGRKHGRR